MTAYKLGRWDITELVKDATKPDFEKQLVEIQRKADQLEKIKTKLNPKISSKDFFKIIRKLEELIEKTNIVVGYSSLLYAADTQSDTATALTSRMAKLSADISNQILFLDLWWKRGIDEKNAKRLIKDSNDLSRFLVHKRLMAKYTLSEPEERIINILDVTGITALVKLYDKITNAFDYKPIIPNTKKRLTREELTVLFRSSNSKIRRDAYREILHKYSTNKGVLGEIYQNIVLNWKNEGIEIRGHSSAISMRNIANDIDDKTVDSLLHTCKKNAPIFQRFFLEKAKMLRLKKLQRYDLYAPVASKIKERDYSYDTAVKLVLESLAKFDPKLSIFAKKLFDQKHVDSSVRHGKKDGAFCSTITPNITPFVLVNFTGKSQDVFTLAHELGHAIHSQFASNRTILIQEPPLPLAETASTFSELLLYDNLSDKISKNEKKIMLAEKIDDLYATIMRQSFFTLFEIDAHEKIATNVTVNEISKAYLKNLKEQFGSSVNLSDDFAIEWSYIPHFYHVPFYCYAYSFGNLLALSLFQRYKKEGRDFTKSYMEILSAGGSKKAESLLAEYSIDISSTKFWQDGFDYVQTQVKNLSNM
jgi:oligoendopeptidase F